MMGLRELVIQASLRTMPAGAETANIIEVGCMFEAGQGSSTLLIAQDCGRFPHGKRRFVSIDYDADHIATARDILARHGTALPAIVEFRSGSSLDILPEVFAAMKQVHFALLDGGAAPEVCLLEFESTLSALAPDGLIVMDDVQTIDPTEAYPAQRTFGKATLVLPELVVSDYIGRRKAQPAMNAADGTPRSPFLERMHPMPAGTPPVFRHISTRPGHAMLAVAKSPERIDAFAAELRRLHGGAMRIPAWWRFLRRAAAVVFRLTALDDLRIV